MGDGHCGVEGNGRATQLDAVTMGAGLDTPQQHIDVIRRFKEVADSVG